MRSEKMCEFWKVNLSSKIWIIMVFIGLSQLKFIPCLSLNEEGMALLKFRERVVNDPYGALSSWNENIGGTDHCSWFGVDCADGHVVSLNLENLCLEGTLSPELRNLLHIKSIILRHNSFCGPIPEEVCELKELELLDLGYNNMSGPLPVDFGYRIPIILLDNNGVTCRVPPELARTMVPSEIQEEESYIMSARHNNQPRKVMHSRILQERFNGNAESTSSNGPPKSATEGRTNSSLAPGVPPSEDKTAQKSLPPSPNNVSLPAPPVMPPPPNSKSNPDVTSPLPRAASTSPSTNKEKKVMGIVAGVVGGLVGLLLVIGIFLWRSNKITTVTGLSGQLQKAFVTGNDRSDGFHSDKPSYVEGIPNLKRSELETACEDFCNVIGSSSMGTVHKGILSNGNEIAVISVAVGSAKDWSRNLETQFRRKIETLSKVNHKNFVNLIGYCEEEMPFTRMMIFEYAPNGTLFEHLHVREAEHLDWGMRLRVATGTAYCLEHLHQLVPPITHPNLNSSAVNLSEDYAAKISVFCFWNEVASAEVQPIGMTSLSSSSVSPESNVYSFGLLLLEMMTGRIPLSVVNGSLEEWVLDYLRLGQPLQDLVDPMLRHFKPEQLDSISEVIRKCLHPDPQQRPTMRDVAARFRETTGIDRNKATPRLSPLWWEELDVRSVNGV